MRGKAAGLSGARKLHVKRPVFLRHKGADLIFTVDNEPRRDRLHAAGRQALADLLPQKRAELIAHDAVEHAARLLRIDQILVDPARLLDGFAHNVLCDFVEGHALRLLIRDIQQVFQVPRNGLALAVRVGCQKDIFTALGRAAQLRDDLFFSLERLILRLKIVFNIHAHRALRQIAQMSHAGLDLIV